MLRVSAPAIMCAENIAIASLFHKIPVLPSSSNPTDYISKGEYILSLDQERNITSTLAFLANIQNDSEYIPAVSIEEDSAAGSLNVIVAVNKVSVSDGDEVLSCIHQGLDDIFALLARVHTNHSSKIKDQVLRAVVSMCSSRILSRLRLGPVGWRKSKRPFKDSLQELIMALRHIYQQKLNDRSLLQAVDTLIIRAKKSEKSVKSWAQHQVTARLIELVESIYQIKQIKQLQHIINLIPNNQMKPSARESFINIVGKVSRYRQAARFLYSTAKKVPLARKMRTVPVHLPREAYTTPSIGTYTPDLRTKVTEASPKGRQQKLLKEICRILGLSEQEAEDQFCRQVNNTLKQAKIHAEVQLIAYFELHSPLFHPRVVCSSKDACFLCDLFIKEYGKIHIPRSHGRLYPAWRLPCLPQLQELERSFCQLLQGNCQESCTKLLTTRRKTLHPPPNESTLFTLPTCSTTLSATVLLEGSNLTDDILSTPEAALVFPEPDQALDSREGIVSANHNLESVESVKRPEGTTPVFDTLNKSAPCIQQASSEPAIIPTILQGSGIFGTVGPNETSELYSAGPLEISIEGIGGSSCHAYYIEWLDVEETEKARNGNFFIIDVEDLDEEITLREHNPLYMTTRGAILRLSWTSKCC